MLQLVPGLANGLSGDIYAVERVTDGAGEAWEVRRWTFSGGELAGDELVGSFETEEIADRVAGILAEGDVDL